MFFSSWKNTPNVALKIFHSYFLNEKPFFGRVIMHQEKGCKLRNMETKWFNPHVLVHDGHFLNDFWESHHPWSTIII